MHRCYIGKVKKRLFIGNWKMYIQTPEEAKVFTKSLRIKMRGIQNADVSLAPSFVHIPTVVEALKKSPVHVGAQGVSGHHAGAHTGDVSAKMLKASGASFVIVGHSERRALGESNDIVRTQMLEAAEAGLAIVLCVGELERDLSGDHFAFIKEQLTTALAGLPKKSLAKLVVAYEPVWAIGKSAQDAMKPQDVQETVIFIKKILIGLLERTVALKVPIVYGGSVEVENAPALLAEGGISGFLIGHASSNVDTFVSILKASR